MSDLSEHLDRQVLKYWVQQEITCPRSGEVLDVRTAKAIRDKDGDIIKVMSPTGIKMLRQDQKAMAYLESKGIDVPE